MTADGPVKRPTYPTAPEWLADIVKATPDVPEYQLREIVTRTLIAARKSIPGDWQVRFVDHLAEMEVEAMPSVPDRHRINSARHRRLLDLATPFPVRPMTIQWTALGPDEPGSVPSMRAMHGQNVTVVVGGRVFTGYVAETEMNRDHFPGPATVKLEAQVIEVNHG